MRKMFKLTVAGPEHHQKALASLMTDKNLYYSYSKKELLDEYDVEIDQPIYEYEIATCALRLRHEPDNPYDPGALQVFADGVFIGYVPKGNLPNLSRISQMPDLQMRVEIYGGRYKLLEYDDEADIMGEMLPKYFSVRTISDIYKAIMVFSWSA